MFSHNQHAFHNRRWRKNGAVIRQICVDLCKNPRISQRATTYHNHITACFFYHLGCILRSVDITVSDYGNRYGLFDLTNYIPIGRRRIHILSGSSMYCDCVSTGLFANTCYFYCIDTVFVPPFTDFHGYRNRPGFFNSRYNISA